MVLFVFTMIHLTSINKHRIYNHKSFKPAIHLLQKLHLNFSAFWRSIEQLGKIKFKELGEHKTTDPQAGIKYLANLIFWASPQKN